MLSNKINALEFDNQSFSEHTTEYLLCLAMDIGEGMLKCGAEIHRVEDTIERVCKAYGAVHVEIFAIPSVIISAIRMAIEPPAPVCAFTGTFNLSISLSAASFPIP